MTFKTKKKKDLKAAMLDISSASLIFFFIILIESNSSCRGVKKEKCQLVLNGAIIKIQNPSQKTLMTDCQYTLYQAALL